MSSVAISGRPVQNDRKIRNENPIRFFVIVIAVLLLVLIGELVFHLVVSPRMTIKHVDFTVDPGLGLDNRALLTLTELGESPFFFGIDEGAIAARLEEYPLIRLARVEKSFPDKLKIAVWGRTPLAIALVSGSESTIPVTFDSEGVVFQIGESVAGYDLPVVSGLTFPDVRLGQRISRTLVTFLSDLERLRTDSPVLFNLISELKFVTKNRSGFEVVLFTKNYPVRIRIGSTIDSELMKRIVLVLDIVSQQDETFSGEIDFRTDDVVMRSKE